jgi:hypothetical protein
MRFKTLALVAAMALALPAVAHEAKGPNGGRIADAGAYHVELVAKDQAVEVFVSDAQDKPLPATGFKAVAILNVGGKAQRIALEPKEPTRLSGTSPVALPREPKGAVQLTSPDGKTASARFN